MSNKNLKQKQKSWDEYYEDKKLSSVIRNYDSEKHNEEKNRKFLLEGRLHLMEDSLQKTKFNSNEFNALLEECISIFLELNDKTDQLDRGLVIKYAKDKLLKNELIGEFDGKKLKQNEDWPFMGRITLRDAIEKDKIGQNPKSKYSENVSNIFGGNKPVDNQPSPSSKPE